MSETSPNLRSSARNAIVRNLADRFQFRGGWIDVAGHASLRVDLRGVGPSLTATEARSIAALLIAASGLAEGGRL